MDRAIQIIKRDIEIRKSKMINKEYILRKNELKAEIESLEKVLKLVTLGLPSVSLDEQGEATVCDRCKGENDNDCAICIDCTEEIQKLE